MNKDTGIVFSYIFRVCLFFVFFLPLACQHLAGGNGRVSGSQIIFPLAQHSVAIDRLHYVRMVMFVDSLTMRNISSL